MKRKTKWLAVGAAAVGLIVTLPFAACTSDLKTIDENVGEYVYYYQQEFVDKHDEYVEIDGRLDEDIYAGQGWMYHGDKGLKFKYTTAFDNYGVYIGAVAYDPEIIYRARYDLDEYVGSNSGFTFYVTTVDNDTLHPMKRLKLETDAKGRRSYSQQRFEAYTTVEGELNGETTSMTTEIFFSWKALGVTEKESLELSEIPEEIKMEPVYRHVTLEAGGMYILETLYPTFTEPAFPNVYSLFGASGYLNADMDDGEKLGGTRLGDAMEGHWMAKTDGWDMTHYLDTDEAGNDVGYVKSIDASGFADVLFFKDVYAENFYAEAYCTVTKESGGSVGLIAQDSFEKFRAVYLENSYLPQFAVRSLTYYPDRVWNQTYEVEYKDVSHAAGDPIHFEMVKNGNTIVFFINGNLVYSDAQSWYSGSFAPGLFALGTEAKFSEYYAEALNDAQVGEKLAELGVSRVVLDYDVRSGAVVTSQAALSLDRNFSFDIALPVGSVVSSFKINGEDVLADYRENVRNGVYEPTVNLENGVNPLINGEGNTLVQIEFESLSYTSENSKLNYGIKKYVGTLKGPAGKLVSDATVTIYEKNMPSIYYTAKTGDNGKFEFNDLPIADYKLDDLTVGGNYVVTVIASGYGTKTYEITVDKDFGKDGLFEQEIELSETLIGKSVTVNGVVYKSLNGWTIDLDKDGSTYAVMGAASSNEYAVFSNVTATSAVVDFTIHNSAPCDSDYDDGVGFGISVLNPDLCDGNGMAFVIKYGGAGYVSGIALADDWVWATGEVYNGALFNTKEIRDQDVRMRFVHSENTVSIFVYDTAKEMWKPVYTFTNDDLAQTSGYALFKHGFDTKTTLKDIDIVYGEDASELVAEMNEARNLEWAVSDNSLTSTGKIEREVKFFEQKGKAYAVETTIEGLDQSNAQAGIVFQAADSPLYAYTVMFDGMTKYAPVLIKVDTWDVIWLLDGTEYNGWMENVSSLKLVNDGTQILLYCNGVSVGTLSSGYESVIGRENTVGFLTIDDSVTFKNYSYETLAWTTGENSLTSTGKIEREMKYFDRKNTTYVVETTIEGLDQSNAQAGIVFQAADSPLYAYTVMFDGTTKYAPVLIKMDTWDVTWLLDGTEYNGWMENVSSLKLVNDGTRIVCYCNDVWVGSVSSGYESVIGRENTVGFLTIDDSVTFKDYSYETFEWTAGENSLTSTGKIEREVKFFEQKGKAYAVETAIEGLDQSNAQAGIVFRAADSSLYAYTVMFDGTTKYAPVLIKMDTWDVTWLLDGTEYNGWMENVSSLKLVNDGTQIVLYCNGVSVGTLSSGYESVIGRENTVGFLTIDDSVTFKDYSMTVTSVE